MLSNGASHSEVMCDEDDCPTMEEFTLEALIHDPSSRVHIESAKDIV